MPTNVYHLDADTGEMTRTPDSIQLSCSTELSCAQQITASSNKFHSTPMVEYGVSHTMVGNMN